MRGLCDRTLRVTLIAVTLCLPGLAAAEDKPSLTLDTKSITASVTIEAALKAYPGLSDNLLAEGRRELAKWRAEADKDRKERPDVFGEGRRYDFSRSYSLRSALGRYVSVVRADYLDGLGAHPNHATNTILWDTQTKKQISIRPFFKETADEGATLHALAKAIRAKLALEKKARDIPIDDPDTDSELAGVKASLLSIGAIALAPSTEARKSSGLIAYFSPYQVGSYAEGDYTVFVPWTEFKTYLSAEGTALFGGERPAGDAEKD